MIRVLEPSNNYARDKYYPVAALIRWSRPKLQWLGQRIKKKKEKCKERKRSSKE
jgi:hypothetical protein